ncbi:MAG TPA: FG-GAP-like repeat-containing protein [Verrucomicrobiales bacterium]|nr:FG-GAP-like repeat-containing protein [Verrucomicrobiales bacterium]
MPAIPCFAEAFCGVLAVSGALIAASSLQAAEIAGAPLAAKSAATATLFEELGKEQTGIDFNNPIDDTHEFRFLYASAMSTGGVAIGDFDRDGKPDIYLINGPGRNKLYRQTGPMKFEDVTAKAGVDGGAAWGTGCAFADVDGDADLDIYVCNYLSPNQLYLNKGDGTFEERAKAFGLDFTDACHTPAFCDYDGDGKLDLYILTNRWYRPEGFPQEQTIIVVPGKGPQVKPEFEKYYDAVQTSATGFTTNVVGRPDILCHNNGNGTFTDVTKKAGVDHRGHGLSATWFDWNGDGRPDLWVGNDFDDADKLYVNNGDSTFTDATLTSVGHISWFSMGADFGDVNGDGLPDFFIADMSGTNHFKQKTLMGSMGDKQWFMENARPPQLMRNSLFLNAGNGRFLEGAYLAQIANSNWTWAARLCDLDNDGRNDLYLQCGMSRNFNEKDDPEARKTDSKKTQWERFKHLPPLKEHNIAYRNQGGLRFEDVSKPWGLDHLGMSYGCAAGDLDGDGDLDIVSVRLDEPVVIYRNNSQDGNRVTFQFAGTASDRFGTGVQVRMESASGVQVRELVLARGYLGCDEPLVHFGLGMDTRITKLDVRWPSGRTQKFENLDAGKRYTLTEPAAATAPVPVYTPPLLFNASPALAAAVHEEKPYDDFAREPLLPNKMSQLGPCQAWGDVDGDGRDDLFLGGARYGARHLMLNHGDLKFTEADDPFSGDLLNEDMGALFFDADGDGDADLYIVSGGVECEAGSPVLQDRLYLNDGKGKLSPAPKDALPAETDSGGPVVAADMDRDGDLDLYVGGRCVPGAYPLPAKSHLLRNDAGKFTDITPPELVSTGMVTAALWSDADGDGWIDLLVAHEWGAVELFHNTAGKLKKAERTGLEKLTGWWNGLAGRDLNGDGDIDYIATNFGRNTKYHPDPAHPALIFYGDMDGSGKSHIVEAEYEGDNIVPIRGRSCSSQAMPFIKEKFSTYKAFALASLTEIYTKEKLESVRKFTAAVLDSGILRNDGKGHFTFEPLPWAAQLTPSFGVAIEALNGDTAPDIVLAQNFYSPQIETGRMASGLSLLLTGDGKGGFTPVWPSASGISEPGDAKSLAVTDLNADGWPDLVFGLNSAPVSVFLARPSHERGSIVSVRLKGKPGNPHAAGAKVTFTTSDAKSQTAEVHAGSGYLSQGPSVLAFGVPAGATIKSITVHWPGGTSSTHKAPTVTGHMIELSEAVR